MLGRIEFTKRRLLNLPIFLQFFFQVTYADSILSSNLSCSFLKKRNIQIRLRNETEREKKFDKECN